MLGKTPQIPQTPCLSAGFPRPAQRVSRFREAEMQNTIHTPSFETFAGFRRFIADHGFEDDGEWPETEKEFWLREDHWLNKLYELVEAHNEQERLAAD